MYEPVLTEEYKGYIIKIYQDDLAEDPREWDNIAKFYCWHREYTLGDDHKFSIDEFKTLLNQHERDWYTFTLYMYEHGTIEFSLSNTEYPFNCPWDSRQVGWVIVETEDIKKNFPDLSEEHYPSKALEIADTEVKIYNDYWAGNVYGYVIEREIKDAICPGCGQKIENELIDSCFGYYGDPSSEGGALIAAKEVIDKLL
ncbi:MAG: hypothetical protein ACUVUQ_11665 [Thermodesulfovibrionales bacterium]